MSRTRIAAHAVGVALLAALGTVPVASAATRPPVQGTQAIHALVVRGQALDRRYNLVVKAGSTSRALRALELRGQALDRMYRLGSA